MSERTPREHPPYVLRSTASKKEEAVQYVDTGDHSREGPRDLVVSGVGLLTLYALFAQTRGSEWTAVSVIDSGASVHMTPLRSM